MRVNTDELQRQSQDLRSQTYRLYEIQESVLRIARSLSRERTTESLDAPLRAAANAIGESCQDLTQLRMALSQIAVLYEQSEARITDEAEAAQVHHEHSPFILTPLPNIFDWPPVVLPGFRFDGNDG